MSEQYHDNIHNDMLRLRVLVTDGCTQSCSHCWNDGMLKPKDTAAPAYLDTSAFDNILTAYEQMLPDRRKVYLSGGEPTTHTHYIVLTAGDRFPFLIQTNREVYTWSMIN